MENIGVWYKSVESNTESSDFPVVPKVNLKLIITYRITIIVIIVVILSLIPSSYWIGVPLKFCTD